MRRFVPLLYMLVLMGQAAEVDPMDTAWDTPKNDFPTETQFKKATSRIRGQLLLKLDPFPAPLGFKRVFIEDEKGHRWLETRTDRSGYFVFAGDLPAGNYTLKIDSKRYLLSQSFKSTTQRMMDLRIVYAEEK